MTILPIRGTKSEVVGIWLETINIKIDIASRAVIPTVIFSLRSSFVEAGVKKPTIATGIITGIDVWYDPF